MWHLFGHFHFRHQLKLALKANRFQRSLRILNLRGHIYISIILVTMWLSRTVKAPISVIVIGDLYIRDLEVTHKGQPRSKTIADSEPQR